MANNQRGIASIEFGLVVGFLAVGMLNVVDIGRYHYERMQVESATQMAAQAAWATCDVTKLPATTKCSGMNTAMTNALQGTSLGSGVTMKSGFPREGYHCINAAGSLVRVSDVSTKPANCAAVGKANERPGDYIQVEARYTYAPLFSGFSVGALLPTEIESAAMVRLQ